MFGLSPLELLVIGLIAVLFFGAKKLPDIGKALGQASKEFTGRADSTAQGKNDPDESGQAQSNPIEDELKNQLISRLPGVGRIRQVQKTVQRAGQVIDVVNKTESPKSDSRS